MKTILKIYTFLKVFGLLMKRPIKKKLIKIRPQEKHQENLIKIGSVEDSLLKATVSVKGSQVYINIDGFIENLEEIQLEHGFNYKIYTGVKESIFRFGRSYQMKNEWAKIQ